jgi:hypothetical protein
MYSDIGMGVTKEKCVNENLPLKSFRIAIWNDKGMS